MASLAEPPFSRPLPRAHRREKRMSVERQGHEPVPRVVGPHLALVEPDLVFAFLKALLDGPALSGDRHHGVPPNRTERKWDRKFNRGREVWRDASGRRRLAGARFRTSGHTARPRPVRRGAGGDIQEPQGARRGAVPAVGCRRPPRTMDAQVEGGLRAPGRFPGGRARAQVR